MISIYINLPVIDLKKSTDFYKAIGFVLDPKFSSENASAMVYDNKLNVMLLTHNFTKGFLPKNKSIANSHTTCEVLNAIQLEDKETVDKMFDKSILAGGKPTIPLYDHGFMYGRDFEDLNGHIREVFWMQPQDI